jgi:type I restriction enzyme M protein
MMKHVRDVVFPFIKDVRDKEKNTFFAEHEDAVFMVPKSSLVQETVGSLTNLIFQGRVLACRETFTNTS